MKYLDNVLMLSPQYGEHTQWRHPGEVWHKTGVVYRTYDDKRKHSQPSRSDSLNGLALLTQPATQIHFLL